jgi:hypothetical protein
LRCKGKSDPLADERDVTGIEDAESVPFKTLEIATDLRGIAAGPGSIRARDKDEKGVRSIHKTSKTTIPQTCIIVQYRAISCKTTKTVR